jgi:crotonobetainyl-CoA:carnitine CoA-transferase CaiB-like acyl-CoA transferase
MGRPLEGIRVFDLSAVVLGPHATVHLADMGAEVIKVEHPAGGDMMRGVSALRMLPLGKLNYLFELDNRNKKSLTLDLGQDVGREIAYKLLPTCDVFLSNFQPLVLQRIKMDYDTVSKINPGIVYAICTGWGLKGPLKDEPGFDYAAFARSGLMEGFAEPGGPLVTCLPGFGDHIAAMHAAYGIMLALFHRQRTGEGQMVHVSLLGGLLENNSMSLSACLTTGQDLPKQPRTGVGNALWNYYQCRDKKWLQLAMLQTDRHWHDFCQALELGEMEKDPKFDSHARRCENNVVLISILDKAFPARTREEWAKRFEGKNIVWGLVQNFLEVTKDPQVWENNYFVPFEHPTAGDTKIMGLSVQLNKTPGEVRTAAPELGQHTEEVLLDLGYNWDDIARLKDQKVIL